MQTVDPRFETQGSRGRRSFLLAAVVMPIVLLAGIAFNAVRTPVDGYLVLGTHIDDQECEIYVGDRLVGIGCAKVPWADILGWHGQESLAILLSDDSPWPPSPSFALPKLTLGEATAERLAGKDATVLRFDQGSPALSRYGSRHRFAHKELLIRRTDGVLDQVFCLDAVFSDYLGRTYRALVPIRVRSPEPNHSRIFASSSTYFTHMERKGNKVVSFGRASVPRNGWIHRYSHEWGFRSIDPPDEFMDDLREGGLWKPKT